MRFEPKFTDEDILAALDKTKPRTAGYIAKQLNCTLITAKSYLKSLLERKKIKAISIDDGAITAYLLK